MLLPWLLICLLCHRLFLLLTEFHLLFLFILHRLSSFNRLFFLWRLAFISCISYFIEWQVLYFVILFDISFYLLLFFFSFLSYFERTSKIFFSLIFLECGRVSERCWGEGGGDGAVEIDLMILVNLLRPSFSRLGEVEGGWGCQLRWRVAGVVSWDAFFCVLTWTQKGKGQEFRCDRSIDKQRFVRTLTCWP